MNKTIYRCTKDIVEVVDDFDLSVAENNKSDVFVVNILAENREEVFEYLYKLDVPESVYRRMLSPIDGLRFKYIKEIRYGELAYFSSKDYSANYGSVIIKENILILVHMDNDFVVLDYLKSLVDVSEKIEGDLVAEYVLYWLVLEKISEYGKLIMTAREEIETIAFNFDHEFKKHSLGEISKSKIELASLEMVLDKLYFTLSFPPSKTILNSKSPYADTFSYLLRNVEMLKSYVDQTQDRLDSLNDHYQLIMHGKTNKRLNFLTITQAIFVPLTLVVGVYGMNFEYMPELGYRYGYFITLGGMLIVAISFLVYFKKNGWFN